MFLPLILYKPWTINKLFNFQSYIMLLTNNTLEEWFREWYLSIFWLLFVNMAKICRI
ncbi:mCG1034138 [Mus musculus]|nr:mCG1034138 [Mus musculus]